MSIDLPLSGQRHHGLIWPQAKRLYEYRPRRGVVLLYSIIPTPSCNAPHGDLLVVIAHWRKIKPSMYHPLSPYSLPTYPSGFMGDQGEQVSLLQGDYSTED